MKNTKQQIENSNYWLHKLCWFLLVINVGWIGVHMFFNYQGALNPWKLGGYAMYTKPSPVYYASIDMVKVNDETVRAQKPSMLYLNLYATGGCLSGISKRFYKKIPIINPDIVTEKSFVRLSFYEQNRDMLERKFSRYMIGKATLAIDENRKMTVYEEFCNKQKEFSIDVK